MSDSNGDYLDDPTTARLPRFTEPESPEFVPEAEARLGTSDQATVDALRPGTALLIALRGPNTGARFLLDSDEVSTGRHPDSDIFLDDVTVSRRHAIFRRTPEGFQVQDVGSLNGTYVNMQLVDSATLRTGDEVMVGKFRLVYHGSPQQTP
ncbi:type III secretion system (T3SS) inner membrane Yop/YscD-like protein [Barrientosiimonas humi]|mgnify:CR=1 FL=1|jgi:pSer/pThr/pTyr-binding forkhead associated (FHA) protein|uniref:Type III secretion system (T3SS) inner membrane Yop/YscD-like protein n=2 Tax=Barrientosiimonas TaxID=1535207 RepID=A0A542XBD1_9MICO|nr:MULTISPECIES: FHA domain-containing protein [Barrientosiimonas]TQL33143.1 type III secretion system (T3SS) inner membrane Yop/YscD-like protein [Barrientosiimonas humi]BDZ58024.1 phosphopeptide-binding protein [Barrientosiimonas endolithica]CAG7573132.1 Glycogen accumulation regulator GarA [Barrientosiimonas humi]